MCYLPNIRGISDITRSAIAVADTCRARGETQLRIRGLIVGARNGVTQSLIVSEVRLMRVGGLMAIVVVGHIGGNVCLIVSKRLRLRFGIVRWKVVPIVRRLPSYIVVSAKRRIDSRCPDEYRLHDIGSTIYIRLTYNLAVGSAVSHLNDDGR